MDSCFVPDWSLPEGVRALSTTRQGGFSAAPWNSFNLAEHVGDDPRCVAQNRQHLVRQYAVPETMLWLQQVHGIEVAEQESGQADASFSRQARQVCVVMTADCLPVLLCNASGTAVAAVHAGWRGLLLGVIENALKRFSRQDEILAWLGPAIGPRAFAVGDEVREAFVRHAASARSAFQPGATPGKWLADIYSLARQRLQARGVTRIDGGGFCTYTDHQRFFSYRRDGRTGRMASMIWLEE